MNLSLKKDSEDWKSYLPVICLIVVALVVRVIAIPFTNYDTDGYSRWYDFIVEHGIQSALGQNFAIYTPPYCLWAGNLSASHLS